jgi:hypothetical protein
MSLFDVFRWTPIRYPKNETIKPLPDHVQQQIDQHKQRAEWYQLKMFEAWRTMWGQTKGLQRQRRIINRLRAEIAELKRQGTGPGDSNG